MPLEKLILKNVKLSDIRPADYNPRIEGAVDAELDASITEFGLLEPIVVNSRENPEFTDHTPTIIGGHQRYRILNARGETETDVVWVNLSPVSEKKANLALNKITGEWDDRKLYQLIEELHKQEADLSSSGYTEDDIEAVLSDYNSRYPDKAPGSIAKEYIVPPFSILDTKTGLWQNRKRAWDEMLGDIAETRENALTGGKFNPLMSALGGGVSNFDPVLTEVMYKWFCPVGGSVLDPFAGEQTKAVVASYLGYKYTGVEIRKEQIDTNVKVLEKAGLNKPEIQYIHADSTKLDYSTVGQHDLLFTCPPYYDLEVYSKDDLSALGTYEEFIEQYAKVFKNAVAQIKDNRFVIVVVGEIRDKKTGYYRNFVGDNIKILTDLGLHYYNELILATALASAPLRARNTFKKRKAVKVHQNVLTFYKGDPIIKAHEQILTFYKGNPDLIPDIYGDVYTEDDILTELDQ